MSGTSAKAHRVWTAPVLIGALTLIGLVGALLVDDHKDLVFSGILAAVILYFGAKGLRNWDGGGKAR